MDGVHLIFLFHRGFKLKFIDINIKTLNLDEDKLLKAIDKNTIAILSINLLGNPCNYEKNK